MTSVFLNFLQEHLRTWLVLRNFRWMVMGCSHSYLLEHFVHYIRYKVSGQTGVGWKILNLGHLWVSTLSKKFSLLRKMCFKKLPEYQFTSLQQKRLCTSLGSSCPTCVHQSPWQSRDNTHYLKQKSLGVCFWCRHVGQEEPKLVYTLFYCKLL